MGSIMWERDVAEVYDQTYRAKFEPSVLDPIVDLLAGLAGGGPALEFAVGTGRVALPLSARGIAVHGLELSPHMAAQLRAKPGAGDGRFVGCSVGGEPVGVEDDGDPHRPQRPDALESARNRSDLAGAGPLPFLPALLAERSPRRGVIFDSEIEQDGFVDVEHGGIGPGAARNE